MATEQKETTNVSRETVEHVTVTTMKDQVMREGVVHKELWYMKLSKGKVDITINIGQKTYETVTTLVYGKLPEGGNKMDDKK